MKIVIRLVELSLLVALVSCGGKSLGPGDGSQSDSSTDAQSTDGANDARAFVCDYSKIGQYCTTASECGSDAKCVVIGDRGVCACENCTFDDPGTSANEDNCGAGHVCRAISVNNGTEAATYCFQSCSPKLGSNSCQTNEACSPDSMDNVYPYNTAVCFPVGCRSNAECPIVSSQTCSATNINCAGGGTCDTGLGRCLVPGVCDLKSGLCDKRTTNFKGDAKIGDRCTSDEECGAAMLCILERQVVGKAFGESCQTASECCSRQCTSGHCAGSICVVHAHQGYCSIMGCAASNAATGTLLECPSDQSSCNRVPYPSGLCEISCDPAVNPNACRGAAGDTYGDYVCRSWDKVTHLLGDNVHDVFGSSISAGPVCDFGDTAKCQGILRDDGCAAFPTTTPALACRDLSGGTNANGFCLPPK